MCMAFNTICINIYTPLFNPKHIVELSMSAIIYTRESFLKYQDVRWIY